MTTTARLWRAWRRTDSWLRRCRAADSLVASWEDGLCFRRLFRHHGHPQQLIYETRLQSVFRHEARLNVTAETSLASRHLGGVPSKALGSMAGMPPYLSLNARLARSPGTQSWSMARWLHTSIVDLNYVFTRLRDTVRIAGAPWLAYRHQIGTSG